jgi:alkylation response protein AidB-like acyl-CoA dehydrogenase
MVKTLATEQLQHIMYAAMKIMGLYGTLQQGSKWAPIFGQFARLRRLMYVGTVAAGSSEIQRNIIAIGGLGLPRR